MAIGGSLAIPMDRQAIFMELNGYDDALNQ